MKKILQVFKRKRKFYICDPEKAKKCNKALCWDCNKGPCKCTKRKAYSKRDAEGKPIVATDEDLINFDYLELRISEFNRITVMDEI